MLNIKINILFFFFFLNVQFQLDALSKYSIYRYIQGQCRWWSSVVQLLYSLYPSWWFRAAGCICAPVCLSLHNPSIHPSIPCMYNACLANKADSDIHIDLNGLFNTKRTVLRRCKIHLTLFALVYYITSH